MTRVLVTGANGFVGRHVISYLLEQTDWEIVALRHKPGLITSNARVTNVSHDLRWPIDADVAYAFGTINYVINLASMSDVPKFLENPIHHTLNNVYSILNLLEWSRTHHVNRFIQVSTNEVYGPAGLDELHTENSPLRPSTPYSGSKASQEVIATSWAKTYDIPVTIVNTMHLFGPGQPRERFVPTAIRCVLEEKPVPIYGHSSPTGEWEPPIRNWLYVRDFAHALHWITTHAYLRDRWNVAGPELTCVQIADIIAQFCGHPKAAIEQLNVTRPGYDPRYGLDTTALFDSGYRTRYGLAVGLQETVNALKTGWINT